MKKILFFVLIANFCTAQHPDLLNTNWEITHIVDEFHPILLPPPMPYGQVTTFSADSPQLVSSFFNAVSAELSFNDVENNFTINDKSCTLADYMDDNGEVNEFFGYLCSFFQLYDNYYYYIQNTGSEKTLVIHSPIFQEIHFKSVNLAAENSKLSQYILAPNPVKDVLTVENTTGINSVSVFDVSGKLVYELKNENAKMLKIDMQNFKTGIYFVKLNNEKTFKIIKK